MRCDDISNGILQVYIYNGTLMLGFMTIYNIINMALAYTRHKLTFHNNGTFN